MEKIKALFFAANPVLTTRISLDEEIRAITEKIHASRHHDSIDLVSALAVQPDDLLQKLNEYKPQIVHFSAHGNTEGELILLDKNGKPKPVSARAIHALLKILKDNIRVVVLNACYSQVQAREIKNVIDCVIGMKNSISDQAAIIFSASFYRAIGFGCSVHDAFEQGKTALLLEGIPEFDIPELLVKEGTDPARIFLLERTPKKDVETGNEKGTPPPDNVSQGVRNVLESIGNPFWILTVIILVSPVVYSFFANGYSTMYNLVKTELSSFWVIYVLFFFYLISTSFGQLRKMIEDIRAKSLLVTLKASILQFGKEAINKPMQLISLLILFLLFFPVIMESDYFFRDRLVYYHFYGILLPLIAVLSLAFIQLKPEKGFKSKISLGIKILSVAIISFLFFFPDSSENSGRRYYGWVDHNLFLDLIKDNLDLLNINRKDRIEKFTKTTLSNSLTVLATKIKKGNINIMSPQTHPKPVEQPNPEDNKPGRLPIEEPTIVADAIGQDYEEACIKAREAARQKYYTCHPQNPIKLQDEDYKFEECINFRNLPTGEVIAVVTMKINRKKEKK